MLSYYVRLFDSGYPIRRRVLTVDFRWSSTQGEENEEQMSNNFVIQDFGRRQPKHKLWESSYRTHPHLIKLFTLRLLDDSSHKTELKWDIQESGLFKRNQVLLLPIIASDEPSIIASVEPPIIATVAVATAAAQKQPEKTLQISSSVSP
ncbi:hypothetical protein L6452_17092 [Arctium lappa]|uniref:Uncharacterized protein n=1 Tax=Arctium lappa TaxID=4217 RepID=A0ACB9C2J9_ARCLA|nr:hypothetical protein L6452_17092 [Arctium lappa]